MLMMRTGAAVGLLAGDREMILDPERVIAGEPGKRVIGGPADGVKTTDEAEGVIVIGKLPIVAITGVGVVVGGGGRLRLENRSIVLGGLTGSPFSSCAVGRTTTSPPSGANERMESETVRGGPPGTNV